MEPITIGGSTAGGMLGFWGLFHLFKRFLKPSCHESHDNLEKRITDRISIVEQKSDLVDENAKSRIELLNKNLEEFEKKSVERAKRIYQRIDDVNNDGKARHGELRSDFKSFESTVNTNLIVLRGELTGLLGNIIEKSG